MSFRLAVLVCTICSIYHIRADDVDRYFKCRRICDDYLDTKLRSNVCQGAMNIMPKPSVHKACLKGKALGFEHACVPSCMGSPKKEGSFEGNSYEACKSMTKKPIPNHQFPWCRRGYDSTYAKVKEGVIEILESLSEDDNVNDEIDVEHNVVVEDDIESKNTENNNNIENDIENDFEKDLMNNHQNHLTDTNVGETILSGERLDDYDVMETNDRESENLSDTNHNIVDSKEKDDNEEIIVAEHFDEADNVHEADEVDQDDQADDEINQDGNVNETNDFDEHKEDQVMESPNELEMDPTQNQYDVDGQKLKEEGQTNYLRYDTQEF